MIYIDNFRFPSKETEFDFFLSVKRKCYNNFYPFQILSDHESLSLDFEAVTILYGGNGSGKTTALNVIAEKLKLKRDSVFNRSSFYGDYINLCHFQLEEEIPDHSRIITSDDVFDYALSLRSMNEGIDNRREEVFTEYLDAKHSDFKMQSLEDYDQLKKMNQARSQTQSRFTRENLMENLRTHSNGENAYRYFTEKLGEQGLFLLDEPENSLSPVKQLELMKFIEESVRYFGCQVIMATHSPFLLAIKGAKIYDFDSKPVKIKPWTELQHVRTYYDFFKAHEADF